MPTVLELVRNVLRMDRRYDGLVSSDSECACETEDLAPCGEMGEECELGHKVAITEPVAGCEACYESGGCEWHMHAGPRPGEEY